MDIFVKAISCGLVAVLLSVFLPGERKELSLMLGIAACCIVGLSAVSYLQPVIELLQRLEGIGNLNTQMISILFKVVGISVVTEIAVLVCKDVGNGALGKILHLLGTSAILWITIPLFEDFIVLIEDILGRI